MKSTTTGDTTGRERCERAPVCKHRPQKHQESATRATAEGDHSLDLEARTGTPRSPARKEQRHNWTGRQYTMEMNVEVERLRLEILFSEPLPPPQDDLSPRRSHAVTCTRYGVGRTRRAACWDTTNGAAANFSSLSQCR